VKFQKAKGTRDTRVTSRRSGGPLCLVWRLDLVRDIGLERDDNVAKLPTATVAFCEAPMALGARSVL